MRKHQVSLLLLGLLFPIAIQAVSLTDSLRQAIYKSIGDEESEGDARWNLIATLGNEVMDSLLLAEAPEQMNWFMHHQQWEHYYDTWDSKINVYLYTEHLQTALREAQTMLDDASSRDNRYGRAMAYQSLGIIYELLGLFDQSVDVFQCCIARH